MKRSLGTILTAVVTPFTADLQVDHATLAALSDHLLTSGSDGLVVAGTTGESPTLSDDEKTAMVRTVVEVAHGRGTVVAATGSTSAGRFRNAIPSPTASRMGKMKTQKMASGSRRNRRKRVEVN